MGALDLADVALVARGRGPKTAAEFDDLAVRERPGRPVGEILELHRAADRAVCDLRVGRQGQPLVHRSAPPALHW